VHKFAELTDAVLVVDRFGCQSGGINKPWSAYLPDFPAEQWHADIVKGLSSGGAIVEHTSSGSVSVALLNSTYDDRIVVGYIDRQQTKRRLPDEQHAWLVEFLGTHPKVEFLHLHMQDYNAQEQIRIASRCHMILGVHGNGMTHTLWMKPRSYVVELFWAFPFQYDYATTAELMRHNYVAIVNGEVLDPNRVARRDPTLRQNKLAMRRPNLPLASSLFESDGKQAIRDVVAQAIEKFL
jgi:Glycosyltransferase 61